MRVLDQFATYRYLDWCGETILECDLSSRKCVWYALPKFQLADLRVSSFAVLRHSRAVVISVHARDLRNEDSSSAVIEDIDCSQVATRFELCGSGRSDEEQARYPRVLFTRACSRRGGSRAYKSRRSESSGGAR